MWRSNKLLILSILANIALIGAIFFIVQRLGGLTYMVHRLNNKDIAGIYEHRKGYFNMLPKEKGGIIFLGDSLTEYGQWTELTQNKQVLNRGIAGDTTPNLMRRLDHIVELAPAKIFLMIGVNDFLFFGRQDIMKNYQVLIERLRVELPNTQLYLQSLLPVNPTIRDMAFDNAEIRLLNKDIQAYAATNDLPFISLHNLLTDEAGNLDNQYTRDGIHLNGIAYNIWYKKIEQYLK